MPVPAEDVGHGRPLPPAAPGTVDDDKGRHAAECSGYQDWDRGPFTEESQDHISVYEVTAAPGG